MENLGNLKSAYKFEERSIINKKETNLKLKEENFNILCNNIKLVRSLNENIKDTYMLIENGFLYYKYGVFSFLLEYCKTALFFKTYLEATETAPISEYMGQDWVFNFLEKNQLRYEYGLNYEQNFKQYSGKKYLKDIKTIDLKTSNNKSDIVNLELYKLLGRVNSFLDRSFCKGDTDFLNSLDTIKEELVKFNTLCEAHLNTGYSYDNCVLAFKHSFSADFIVFLDSIGK